MLKNLKFWLAFFAVSLLIFVRSFSYALPSSFGSQTSFGFRAARMLMLTSCLSGIIAFFSLIYVLWVGRKTSEK
ncbi:MAG: hypothetical protein BMS9Abin02_1772 [Anaerolineae bacterium]|nr:MAG: hypothetical protein BMS9Abin02_1772 [Anaerolineae bacterium]